MSNKSRTQTPEWTTLQNHHAEINDVHLRDLFANDPSRFDLFSLSHEGLLFDYSKQKITSETLTKLIALARTCEIEDWRKKMFSGDKINTSENRAVLHTALRRPEGDALLLDGEDIMPMIHQTLAKMKSFTNDVHKGNWSGFSGKKITDIVNIGIGGSDLGPHVICEALKPFARQNIKAHFISNIDSAHITSVLANLNPETTLFIVASKSFGTLETLTNAQSAKEWVTAHYKDEKATQNHFVAITANNEGAVQFGTTPENIFPLWDWAGGRFSLWSAIGLSACLYIGFDNFQALLDGAHSMDQHFETAPLEKNIPIIMAMIGIWNQNFCGHNGLAILPYDQNLIVLPAYLQQIDMESNGKNIDRNGNEVDYKTSPTVFGTTGTNAQHAFLQMFHQGTEIIPSDFIISIHRDVKLCNHHGKLLANALGQSQALMMGQEPHDDTPSYNLFEGNRPSSTILLNELTPYNLGMLLALYEHKAFIQGVIWHINSFDQWGVALGKTLAKNILLALNTSCERDMDSSTQGLIDHIKSQIDSKKSTDGKANT